ncbi:MAG: DUF2207 domain-containing protein, partial [Clostridiales bacterium]|nr:DUF2207 domain-containing protein [Clostridiales bacterium]
MIKRIFSIRLVLSAVLISGLLCAVCFAARAETVAADAAGGVPAAGSVASNFTIENYAADVTVGADKVLAVTENITMRYKSDGVSVGMIRDIARLQDITFEVNGKIINKTYLYAVSDVNVLVNGKPEYFYTEYYGDSNDTLSVYIGKDGAYKNAAEDYTYTITYKYNLGKTGISGYEEFVLHVITGEWSTPIKRAEFSITMPGAFDKNALSVYGMPAETDDDNKVWVDGRTIRGIRTAADYAITARLILPTDYFGDYKLPMSAGQLVIYCALFGFAVVAAG